MKVEISEERRLVFKAICLGIILLVLALVVYLFLMSSRGWFSNSKRNDTHGNSTGVIDTAQIVLRKQSNGPDIDTLAVEERFIPLSPDTDTLGDHGLLEPGTSGTFTVFVVRNPDSLESSYHLKISVDSIATAFEDDAEPEQQEIAQKYLNTHIAFFLKKDGDQYSERIPNIYDTAQYIDKEYNETVPDQEMTVTVYWVWINLYTDIGSAEFDEASNAALTANIENNTDMWFAEQSTASTAQKAASYNEADAYLATIIRNIKFHLKIETY